MEGEYSGEFKKEMADFDISKFSSFSLDFDINVTIFVIWIFYKIIIN